MSFWRRWFGGGGSSGDDLKPQRLDYLNEALALERQGDYDAALTSYRLRPRHTPTGARLPHNTAVPLTNTPPFRAGHRDLPPPLAHDPLLASAPSGPPLSSLPRTGSP